MRSPGRPRTDLKVRFWSKVKKGPDCWEWQAGRSVKGYGRIGVTHATNVTRNHAAHRVSYEMHHGPIPDGMLVCHHCDNPPCVNPTHLFLGTPQDNTRDMWAKGRHPPVMTNLRITDEQIAEIRRLYQEGVLQREIAERFGISQPHVSAIVNRRARTTPTS